MYIHLKRNHAITASKILSSWFNDYVYNNIWDIFIHVFIFKDLCTHPKQPQMNPKCKPQG